MLEFIDTYFDLLKQEMRAGFALRDLLKRALAMIQHEIPVEMEKERKLLTELIDRDPKLAGESDLRIQVNVEAKNEHDAWLKDQISEAMSRA